MPSDNDIGYYNVPVDLSPPTTSLPGVIHFETRENLGAGASWTAIFNADFLSIIDGFVSADQILTVTVYSRQDEDDDWRVLTSATGIGGTSSGDDTKADYIIGPGQRVAGSQIKIEVANRTAFATTDLSAQFHIRSL